MESDESEHSVSEFYYPLSDVENDENWCNVGNDLQEQQQQNSQEQIDFSDKRPHNKRFINLACSICTGKYQTSVFFARTSLRSVRTVKTSVWYFPVQTSHSVNNILLLCQNLNKA